MSVFSKKLRSAGFTLVELVVVIIILGILAAVAIPKFFSVAEEAERSNVAAMVSSLESALNMYCSKQYLTGQPIVPHNPFDELSNVPSNYNGTAPAVNPGNTPDKTWTFRNDGWIMYNPSQSISGGWTSGGEQFIIYRIDPVVDASDTVGLMLNTASYAYSW